MATGHYGTTPLLDDMGLSGGGGNRQPDNRHEKLKITPTETYESIKLGIDAHAKWHYVARQLDGAPPQPVQKMDFEGVPHFVAGQERLAREVHTCDEVGVFGYHR